ncbi:metastasis-suppressor KiSS-1-like isoform X2 [Carettochelys insculpta]|uniref:metastasis-suppressor KiSS-1-like isoform X2 n=1 Tax=Carettochelys insculpta TaxID=44489 RepID=UPI003EB9027F
MASSGHVAGDLWLHCPFQEFFPHSLWISGNFGKYSIAEQGLDQPGMSPFSIMLLLLFFGMPFGKPEERYVLHWSPQHTGDPLKYLARLAHEAPGKAEPKPMSGLLDKLPENQVQLEQGIRPARSRAISVLHNSPLVGREKDFSTYNWNSFGLCYSKRSADVVEAKVKIF